MAIVCGYCPLRRTQAPTSILSLVGVTSGLAQHPAPSTVLTNSATGTTFLILYQQILIQALATAKVRGPGSMSHTARGSGLGQRGSRQVK